MRQLIEDCTGDRLARANIHDHVPRFSRFCARALNPAIPDHVKMRREIPFKPIMPAIKAHFMAHFRFRPTLRAPAPERVED